MTFCSINIILFSFVFFSYIFHFLTGIVFGKTDSKDEDLADEVPDTLAKLLNGFFLTVTCRGQIVLISSTVEQYLGHCQVN